MKEGRRKKRGRPKIRSEAYWREYHRNYMRRLLGIPPSRFGKRGPRPKKKKRK